METAASKREDELQAARRLLRCILQEQRRATEELHAATREFETVLQQMLRRRADGPIRVADSPSIERPLEDPVPAGGELSLDDLMAEAERLRAGAREAIRESARLRLHSEQLRTESAAAPPKTPQSLSKREREVLQLMVAGRTSRQIGQELGISFKTAVTHRASIMSKMNVHEVASVVREAIRLGLV